MIEKNYVTVTGTKYNDTDKKINVGDTVIFLKDFDNPYDDEAIAVFSEDKKQIGYVANSIRTVAKGTFSAGRLYDKFDSFALGIIRFIIKETAIVEVFYEEDPFHLANDFQLEWSKIKIDK